MVVGTDFGAGVATGALFEAVRSIWDLIDEIKANKHAAYKLAQQCQKNQTELLQIFQDSTVNGLQQDDAIYRTIQNYTLNFQEKLEEIRADMQSWAQMDVWDRIIKKSSMASKISEHHVDLLQSWTLFQAGMQGQILASGAKLHTIARTNSLILQTLTHNTAELQVDFNNAQAADHESYKEFMQSTASTLNNVQHMGLDVSEKFTNVLKKHDEILRTLKRDNSSAARESEDPDVIEARNVLITALENYAGDRPLFSMDSSELTVPLEVHRGDHAVICKGVRAGTTVAIKKVNVDGAKVEVLYKRINRESKIWQQLQHRNVVRFLGCCGPRHELPYMISEWMPNGNARVYARKNANRNVDVDCVRISPPIIHGGLKASNILIDADGTARITDFALASIAVEAQTGSRPPPMRWSAPEVLEGESHGVSSDMYSYACVILEIITDADPFSKYNHLYRLHRLIREGLRPEFPQSDLAWRRGLTSPECALWKLMQECWAPQPDQRPTAGQARDRVLKIWNERRAKPRAQGAGRAVDTVT